MRIFKGKLFLIGSVILTLASCKIQTLPFDFKTQTGNCSWHFFGNLSSISKRFETDTQKVAFNEIRSFDVYATTFSEKWVESSNLVEFALLNDSTFDRDVKEVVYDNGTRNRYSMYIIVLNTEKNSWDTTRMTIVHRQPCLFFTIQQNADEKCIGFGPVYFGILQTNINRNSSIAVTQIEFQKLLQMEYDKTLKCYSLEKKSDLTKSKSALIYVLDKEPRPNENTFFNIEEIVLPLESEIGGGKRLAIPVSSVMGEGLSLPFKYINHK